LHRGFSFFSSLLFFFFSFFILNLLAARLLVLVQCIKDCSIVIFFVCQFFKPYEAWTNFIIWEAAPYHKVTVVLPSPTNDC
jgi:hypothetical protein